MADLRHDHDGPCVFNKLLDENAAFDRKARLALEVGQERDARKDAPLSGPQQSDARVSDAPAPQWPESSERKS